jgi:hypothetical protein
MLPLVFLAALTTGTNASSFRTRQQHQQQQQEEEEELLPPQESSIPVPQSIFVGSNASTAEQFAASVVQTMLARAGHKLPIVHNLGSSGSCCCIAVGYAPSLRLGVRREQLDSLDPEGGGDAFLLWPDKHGSVALGAPANSPRGSVNAAYTFLRHSCGFAFLAANETTLPRLPLQRIRVAAETSPAPTFHIRDTTEWGAAQDPYGAPGYYSAEARANYSQALGLDGGSAHGPIGGHVGMRRARMPDGNYSFGSVHTVYELLSPTGSLKDCRSSRTNPAWSTSVTEPCPATYAAHPNWFVCRKIWPPKFTDTPLIGPLQPNFSTVSWPCKPQDITHPWNSHLCWAAPGVQQALAAGVRRVIHADPTVQYVAVDEMDGNSIYCPLDQAAVTKHKSFAAPIMLAVNAVAQMLETEFPHVRIETIAYHTSIQPPQGMQMHKNVVIRFCGSQKDHAFGYDDKRNNGTLSQLQGWLNIASTVTVWSYMGNIDWPLAPYPYYTQLAHDIEFLVRKIQLFLLAYRGCMDENR